MSEDRPTYGTIKTAKGELRVIDLLQFKFNGNRTVSIGKDTQGDYIVSVERNHEIEGNEPHKIIMAFIPESLAVLSVALQMYSEIRDFDAINYVSKLQGKEKITVFDSEIQGNK
jgi:hypothetical protein